MLARDRLRTDNFGRARVDYALPPNFLRGRLVSRDEAAIHALVGTWMPASRAGDTAAVLAVLTGDVIFLTPCRTPFGKCRPIRFPSCARKPT